MWSGHFALVKGPTAALTCVRALAGDGGGTGALARGAGVLHDLRSCGGKRAGHSHELEALDAAPVRVSEVDDNDAVLALVDEVTHGLAEQSFSVASRSQTNAESPSGTPTASPRSAAVFDYSRQEHRYRATSTTRR